MCKSLLDRFFIAVSVGVIRFCGGMSRMHRKKADPCNEMQRNSDALHMAYLQESTLKCGQDV
ncbi:hypothetical protein CPA45_05185 [Vreelandella nigrificans]|uniref:Uncharacterized protein n=1 Tax=Vreelandella nigrificans TaxID=2042704 RepID=A0A2A4HQR5_9GAMM|nr:hypothetical protein CPA45_05185 [Halomonas nigrificans]